MKEIPSVALNIDIKTQWAVPDVTSNPEVSEWCFHFQSLDGAPESFKCTGSQLPSVVMARMLPTGWQESPWG